jgi:hypothetical protein
LSKRSANPVHKKWRKALPSPLSHQKTEQAGQSRPAIAPLIVSGGVTIVENAIPAAVS